MNNASDANTKEAATIDNIPVPRDTDTAEAKKGFELCRPRHLPADIGLRPNHHWQQLPHSQ